MTRLTEQDAIVQAVADYNAGVTQSNNSLAGAGQIQRLVYQYMAAGVTTNPTRQTPIGRIMGYIFDNATFSPLSLFSAGEVGAWYDPSDFSTMFQDSAGTTPVTAVEQPVGLILDKSKGLVLGSELVTNAADREFTSDTGFWVKEGSATISGGVVNINNTSGQAPIYKFNFPNEPGGYYEISFDLVLTAGSVKVLVGSSYSDVLSTSGRKTVRLYSSAVGTFGIVANATPTTGTIDNLTIKRIEGNHASQATATSRPVLKIDANGKYYLLFDGVDDSLATAAINFSATDKMTVWAGVRKLADIAPGAQSIVMLSNDTSATNGTFSLMARNTYAPYYYAAESKGTTKQDAITASASYAAPVTSVLTGLSDISGDSVKLRINGADIQTDVGDQGTGNYASNQALKIFIRDGGSNLNGNLYSLIVRGAASTAAEITSGEQYVATKSGVTL